MNVREPPTSGRSSGITNEDVAGALERVSDLLATQNGNPFRVRAYTRAAHLVRQLDRPLWEILGKGGIEALDALPDIGPGLAVAIEALLRTGRLPLLDRLEGEVSPESLFTTVPGIGPTLAERIHLSLGIETLEDLEAAAHDGRLEALPGFGPRRARAVRETLASILSRGSRRRALATRGGAESLASKGRPPPPLQRADWLAVSDLLAIDRQYRDLATRGLLVLIAPRRFNPTGERWLPVLHTKLGDWDVTALYSNTALAHQLERTHDWVVVYAEHDGIEETSTVVTERRGDLTGLRVVRGREPECRAYYHDVVTGSPPAPAEDDAPFLPGLEVPANTR